MYMLTDRVGNKFFGQWNELVRRAAALDNRAERGWHIADANGRTASFRSSPAMLLRAGYTLSEIRAQFVDWD